MNPKILSIIPFMFSALLHGQDFPSQPHQFTSPVSSARFEVIQSPLVVRLTFKLDRYTGRIWQIVKTRLKDNEWEESMVIGLPKINSPTKPRFQVFTSGLVVRHTFLLDTVSGTTWVFTSTKGKDPDGTDYEYTSWQPF